MVRLALPRPRPPDGRARQGRRAGRRRHPSAAGAAAAVLAALCVSACAAPDGSPAGAPASLYVATTGDGTITQLDAATGRAVGAPLPAGPGPWQIATGPDGSLVILSYPRREGAELTYVVRAAAGWEARPVPLEPHARPTALAGDGGPYAAVAYRVQDSDPAGAPQPCRVALLDMRRGVVERTATPCGLADSVLDLAFERDPAGPVAYLAMWRWPADGGGRGAAGTGRVVTLDLATGATTAVQPLAGAPLLAVTAAAPAGFGRRLYVVEGTPGPETADEWRLLGLNPDSLAVEHALPLPEPPVALAVAADGGHAYVLAPRGSVLGRSRLYRVDLTTGSVRLLTTLPGRGLGLAAAADRIYVSQPEGNRVWTFDSRGKLVKTVSVGRYPTALAQGSRR